MLGFTYKKTINDLNMLNNMRNLVYANKDTRPVWVGPGEAYTDINEHKNYSDWANAHWAMYYGFLDLIPFSCKNILDIGCGVGFNTINLANLIQNCSFIGYDIDTDVISFANSYNKQNNIIYKEIDIIGKKFPQNVDCIFLIEILEHIKHIYHYNLIDECLNCLNPGGKLFISTPKEEIVATGNRGHIGILTTPHFNAFKLKYENNIIENNFYNNKILTSGKPYITSEPSSHYRIIMEK